MQTPSLDSDAPVAQTTSSRSMLIGVCGGSGSGKTVVVDSIVAALGSKRAVVISQDSYYRDYPGTTYEERSKVNFDHPDAFDNELLVEQLIALRGGQTIEQPVYDFKTHARSEQTTRVKPHPIILLDGILIFQSPLLRELLDIKIYVDCDADIRLTRRIRRDMNRRARSLDSILRQYETTVRPMHEQFVEPSKQYADIIIPRGGKNTIAIDMVIARLKSIV